MVSKIDESIFSLLDEPGMMWIGDKPKQEKVEQEQPIAKPVNTQALDDWPENHANKQSLLVFVSIGIFILTLIVFSVI